MASVLSHLAALYCTALCALSVLWVNCAAVVVVQHATPQCRMPQCTAGLVKSFFATPHELMLACSAILCLVPSALEVEHSGLHLGSCTQAWTEQGRMFKETMMTLMIIVLMLILVTGEIGKDSQFCNGSESLFLCIGRRWDSQPLSRAPRGRPWQRRSR